MRQAMGATRAHRCQTPKAVARCTPISRSHACRGHGTSSFHKPAAGVFWMLISCSLIVLLKNSSSNRASLFLWTTAFFSMFTNTCAAKNHVCDSVWICALADNNFGRIHFSVDNAPVALKKSTGLSTVPRFSHQKSPPSLRRRALERRFRPCIGAAG